MIEAGRLRHRLQIQAPTETQDQNTGAVNVTWSTIATVWGAIEPLSARDLIAAQATDSEVDTRIVIRYRTGITSKMRMHHAAKGVYYDIATPLSDKDSGLEYLTIVATSGLKYD